MKQNVVQISIAFLDWKDLEIAFLPITDFEKAIKLVKCLGIKNVRLRQDDKVNGGTIEWDNF
jgi:hypothetical protein